MSGRTFISEVVSALSRRGSKYGESQLRDVDPTPGLGRRQASADSDVFGSRLPLRAATDLRSKLAIDETFYRFTSGFGVGNPRDYYLYGVLDEVVKAATAAIRWEEILSDEDETEDIAGEDSDEMIRLERLVTESVADEQALWQRKLSEHLVDLICFTQTNDEEQYRGYLAAAQLSAYLRLQQDFRDFHASKSANVDKTIGLCIDVLRPIAAKTRPWYLHERLDLESELRLSSQVFAPFRPRYKQALPLANQAERVQLGVSYDRSYSRNSRSLHANVGGVRYDLTRGDLRRNSEHVCLIAAQLVVRAYELTGEEPTDVSESLVKVLGGDLTDADQLLTARHVRDHEIGDLVLAYGDLAEVVDVAESEFGYRSYKVKYLSKPPIPDISEDWFPAEYVQRIVRKRSARDFYRGNLERSGRWEAELKQLMSMTDDQLYESMRRFFTAMAHHGLLEEMLRGSRLRREGDTD